MTKPKVLPGLVSGHARLALLLQTVFFLPPVRGCLGGCGWKQQGLVWPCHTQWLSSVLLPPRGGSPLCHQEDTGGNMATSAGLAGAPCSCRPLQGLAQYCGSPTPTSCTDSLVLYHRSR